MNAKNTSKVFNNRVSCVFGVCLHVLTLKCILKTWNYRSLHQTSNSFQNWKFLENNMKKMLHTYHFFRFLDLIENILDEWEYFGCYQKSLHFPLCTVDDTRKFCDSVDQDQTAQNVQSYLLSTLSTSPFFIWTVSSSCNGDVILTNTKNYLFSSERVKFRSKSILFIKFYGIMWLRGRALASQS